MSATEQPCPPHHWIIESREVEHQIVDFHRCVRCGQAKATPRVSSTGWPGKAGAPPASADRAGRARTAGPTPSA